MVSWVADVEAVLSVLLVAAGDSMDRIAVGKRQRFPLNLCSFLLIQ